MTANRVNAQSESVTADDVRVCERCGRVLPALHKDEYTASRARLVATIGFCVCPTAGPDAVAPIPDSAPSLV